MTRTIGTIMTDLGTSALIHDDETGAYNLRMPNGVAVPVADWTSSTSWRIARRAAQSWYGVLHAYHDTWVLCLRPIRSLETCTSECMPTGDVQA